jgi:acyl carrier protein
LKQALLDGIATILDVPAVTPETVLAEAGWDSLAVVCVISLIDEKTGAQIEGEALSECTTVAEVLALARVAA